MRRALPFLLLCAACATNPQRRVEEYRAAHQRGDLQREAQLLAPGARMWFEKREGTGEPLRAGGDGRYAHWDKFFHSRSTLSDWTVNGDAVTATVHETNDFYRLLDWQPLPYRMTWWLDGEGRITGAMVQSMPGKAASRMDEFRQWAAANEPKELDYLMPNGRIDPTGDRAERWQALLDKWRDAAGLPKVQ